MEENDMRLVERVRELRPIAIAMVAKMPNEVLQIRDPLIIEAAWGPRVTTSRTRGMDLRAYPSKIEAHKELIMRWLTNPGDRVKVVIAKKKAQARIDAALAHTYQTPEDQRAEPVAPITQEEIEDMMAKREELRAARLFADADKIRDYLVAHGVTVSDAKVT